MRVSTSAIEIAEKDAIDAYRRVRGENTYLLESSEGAENLARYSILGFNAAAKLISKDGRPRLEIYDPSLKGLKPEKEDPLNALRALMAAFRQRTTLESRFTGGAAGYYSYDLVRYFLQLETGKGDLKQPDCEFVIAKNNLVFDYKEGKTYLLEHTFFEDDERPNNASDEGLAELAEELSGREAQSAEGTGSGGYSSNATKHEFEENVRRAKEYIRAGDILQAVLSQRFETEYLGDKFAAYLKLKEINPSPYMYYLDLGNRKVAGSSPEMLLRVEDRRVETYPIAGTRPRGKTPEEDYLLAQEMLSDEKEKAEHLMLVDLGRNDIGRVAEYGSVKVRRFMGVEKYSHVQHMVSEVCGNLSDGANEFDALKSIFPAGTVSGAPKVRAMEIIDELEPTKRGIYAGCVGYSSFNGNMDAAITIRTIVFESDRAYVQAGAGIVADSKPENEYIETVNKGRGILLALGARD